LYIHHSTETISTEVPRIVTIGSFDGVHKGHQVILQRLSDEAYQRNGESIVVTFEPHPRILLRPDDNRLESAGFAGRLSESLGGTCRLRRARG